MTIDCCIFLDDTGKCEYKEPPCNETFRIINSFCTPDNVKSGQTNLGVTNRSGLVSGLLHSLKKAVGAASSVPSMFQIRDTAGQEGDLVRMLNDVLRRVLADRVTSAAFFKIK